MEKLEIKKLLLEYHQYLVGDGIDFPIALDEVYVDEFIESKGIQNLKGLAIKKELDK